MSLIGNAYKYFKAFETLYSKKEDGRLSLSCLKVCNQKNGRVRSRTGDLSHAKGTRYQLRHTPVVEVVPSRIELLILALLAPRLNQLGQGT